MPKGLAFPAEKDVPVELADLAYLENPAKNTWVFAGPYRIPFVLTLINEMPGVVPEARLTVPTLQLNNWAGEPSLAINCDSQAVRCYLPRDFDFPDDPEDCAYAIINHMAEKLRVEAVRTSVGTLSDMTDLIQAISNLTGRSFTITCGVEEDGVIQVTSSKNDLIQNTALYIVIHFNPHGTSPASMAESNIHRRQPTQLPMIKPEKDQSAHQQLKDAEKVQSFLEANQEKLGISPKSLKNRLKAFGL